MCTCKSARNELVTLAIGVDTLKPGLKFLQVGLNMGTLRMGTVTGEIDKFGQTVRVIIDGREVIMGLANLGVTCCRESGWHGPAYVFADTPERRAQLRVWFKSHPVHDHAWAGEDTIKRLTPPPARPIQRVSTIPPKKKHRLLDFFRRIAVRMSN